LSSIHFIGFKNVDLPVRQWRLECALGGLVAELLGRTRQEVLNCNYFVFFSPVRGCPIWPSH
jgi:hypothetical protein